MLGILGETAPLRQIFERVTRVRNRFSSEVEMIISIVTVRFVIDGYGLLVRSESDLRSCEVT